MITLSGVEKRYGSFQALRPLDLEVRDGEVFGFLGPNGAGKTTTIRMLSGVLKPTAGTIHVDDIDIILDPVESRRRIGYIPDRPYLYEKLTAREFLEFVGGIYGVDPATIRTRGDALLAENDLLDRADELVEAYSHGMKQRLVMASVFLHEPELLIVDEPMVGLDPRGARRLKQLLKRECRDRGLTVLLSTHTLVDVEELCDQIMLIHQGELLAQGTAEELRASEGERLEEIFLRLTEGAESSLSSDED